MAVPSDPPNVDWSRLATLYRQCLSIASDVGDDGPAYLPAYLPAFLAQILSRVSASYHGQEAQFVSEAVSKLGDRDISALYADERFSSLPEYGGTGTKVRRRPVPFEAMIETARRLRDMREIEAALTPVTLGAILGGSLSYGRFFNVRGALGGEGSDIDLLLLLKDFEDLPKVIDAAGSLPFVDAHGIERARQRAVEFADYRAEAKRDGLLAFSAKLPVWGNESDPMLEDVSVDPRYHLSLHIFDPASFATVTHRAEAKLADGNPTERALMYDFRESSATRSDHQRSFSGENARLPIASPSFQSSYVRETHIYHVGEGGAFYPGMFQNLILPAFDVRWGGGSFRRDVDAFRWKMIERLRRERTERPDEILRLSFSHTRSGVFAPHVVAAVDASTVLS